MTLGLAFWVLFILWVVFSLWARYPFERRGDVGVFALQALMIFFLGWAVFGFVIRA